MKQIRVSFLNEDGNPVSHYELGPAATAREERVPITNDDEAWQRLAVWMLVNRTEAVARATAEVLAARLKEV